jgi:hypothetical protein
MNLLIYCLRHLLYDWRFLFEGMPIYENDTLASHGLEDGDCIDACKYADDIIRLLR